MGRPTFALPYYVCVCPQSKYAIFKMDSHFIFIRDNKFLLRLTCPYMLMYVCEYFARMSMLNGCTECAALLCYSLGQRAAEAKENV